MILHCKMNFSQNAEIHPDLCFFVEADTLDVFSEFHEIEQCRVTAAKFSFYSVWYFLIYFNQTS